MQSASIQISINPLLVNYINLQVNNLENGDKPSRTTCYFLLKLTNLFIIHLPASPFKLSKIIANIYVVSSTAKFSYKLICPIKVKSLQKQGDHAELSCFLAVLSSRDVRRFKDVRKEFERGSESLEGAQVRNAQAPRGKQHEVEEASNALLNARRAFRSEALDYVLEVRKNSLLCLRPLKD